MGTYWRHHRSAGTQTILLDMILTWTPRIDTIIVASMIIYRSLIVIYRSSIVYPSFIHRLLIMVCLLFAYGSWFNVVAFN